MPLRRAVALCVVLVGLSACRAGDDGAGPPEADLAPGALAIPSAPPRPAPAASALRPGSVSLQAPDRDVGHPAAYWDRSQVRGDTPPRFRRSDEELLAASLNALDEAEQLASADADAEGQDCDAACARAAAGLARSRGMQAYESLLELLPPDDGQSLREEQTSWDATARAVCDADAEGPRLRCYKVMFASRALQLEMALQRLQTED